MCMQVCSSWTAVNRGTSRRSAATPLGDAAVPSVALGNLLAVRSAILIWVLEAAGAVWLVEQPLSSLLWHHPRMVGVLRGLRCFRLTICMCDYGAATLKPTLLVGNVSSLGELSEWRVPSARKVHFCLGGGMPRRVRLLPVGFTCVQSMLCHTCMHATFVQTERRLEPRQMVQRWVDHAGRERWSGGPDLRRSQIYPQQFAHAAAPCMKLLLWLC